MDLGSWAIILVPVLGVIFIALIGIRLVRPTEKGIVERFGKFHRVAHQGLNWIVPVVDQMIYVNTTEQMADVPPQEMITKDNLNCRVDLVVYYKVKRTDAEIIKALYNVDEYAPQIITLAQTTARNVIGTMKFEVVNSERDKVNFKLQEILDKETNNWGIEIVRVEVMEITPPGDVQETMNDILKANNTQEAAKDYATAEETKADGFRRAEIKKADGEKQGKVLRAEGEKQAIQKVADANAYKYEQEQSALQKFFVKQAVTFKQLDVAQKALSRGTKYVIDSDKPIMNVLSEVAGITPVPTKKKE